MATHHQQQQPSQLAPTPTTEEEEFLKRNTDCVYFLASPLTCKKGSECEYRHSDIARVNPRDCWYWLNGNCLNPKCGFRHPPFDGLLGAEAPTPVAPTVPPATSKQGVACIFFQKGFCLKGHLCPFLHGPSNIVNNKAAQPPPPSPVTMPPKMAVAGPENQLENVQKPGEFLPTRRKQVVWTPALARNGGSVALEKKAAPPPPVEEPPRYRPASVVPPPMMNEFPVNRSNHGVYETHHVSDNDSILNGKDADEYSREPTPGFDVLVDNELGDSEYYRNEEQFRRSNSHDFDIDRDMYTKPHDYERYAWEDHGAANLERKRYPREESPDRFDESDLRHRISKQRRGNNFGGLRSVVSRDSHSDRVPRRDGHHRHRPDQGGSLSSRLRGRIKIPGRSMSPGNENESGRQHRSRYSPHVLHSHNRLRDRIKGKVSEDYNNDSEFTGPKRLSELKRGHEEQREDRKRKYPSGESRQSEDNLSFEGPKPLSEILKRKRGLDNNDEEELKREREVSKVGKEAGAIDEDAILDQELEAYDHRDGDYDYEQIDGEDYNLDEGENPNPDEEYMDGDEYGKKESDVCS